MATVKTRLAQFRESLGLNQTEMAKKIGVHQRNWSRYENGDVSTPEDVLLRLAGHGLNLHWLHTGIGQMRSGDKQENLLFAGNICPAKTGTGELDIIHESVPDGLIIPYLEQPVSAGPGATLEDIQIPERFLTVPRELARFQSLSALPVRGDSMAPTLHEGDMVVCDSGGWDGDGVYVIRTQEQAFVKRVILTPSGYQVVSDNKLYPPYTGNREDVVIVGKVRCAVIRLE